LTFSFGSEEASALASECGMRLYRTSVKEDINVGGLFHHLAEDYVKRTKERQQALQQGRRLPQHPRMMVIGQRQHQQHRAPMVATNRRLAVQPQDYLAGPMFDSLRNGHNNHAWSMASPTSSEAPIVLRPLSQLKKKKRRLAEVAGGIRSPLAAAGTCKVL